MRDYTEELRAEKVAEVEMFERLIEVWSKDTPSSDGTNA